MSEINVNDEVWVRLRTHAKQRLREKHWALFGGRLPYSEPVEDKNGWSRWKLWELFQKLGSEFNLGEETPFDCEILTKDPAEKSDKALDDSGSA